MFNASSVKAILQRRRFNASAIEPKSAETREEYEARPYVCEWCGYRVNRPCTVGDERRNCDNA